MEREEFTTLAQEILGDRNDDKALAFAKACGELFDAKPTDEIDNLKKELETVKADNDRIRNEYRDLYFKGASAKVEEEMKAGTPAKTANVSTETETAYGSSTKVKVQDLNFNELFK